MMNFGNKKTTRLANTSRILRLYSLVFFANVVLIVTIAMTSAYASDTSSSSPENDVSTLEMKFFAHNYSTDSLDKRIDRLEEFVFGTTKSGTEQDRIKTLLDTVPDTPEDTTNDNQSTDPTTENDKPNLAPETASSGKPQDNRSNDQTDTDNSSRAPSESYPAVTALEQQILGKTNESSPIDKRLSKLETKAFGKSSQSNDLSQRVDLLQQYLANRGTQNNDNLATDEPPVKWGDHPLGITQQIGIMEQKVFGKTYSKDKITSRLHKLEKKVFPKQPPETFAPIAARVTRLQAAIQSQQPGTNYNTAQSQSSTNDQSSPPGTIQPFASTGASSPAYQSSNYGNPATDTFNNNPNTNATTTQSKQRSLLGKIGQIAGGVGSVALRSMGGMGGMGMGGYGYGYPSYGYGGYGGGYPAYGSGYGYSPYGMGMGGGYGVSPFSSPIGGAYW